MMFELRVTSCELRVRSGSRDATHRRGRPSVRRRPGSNLETRNSKLTTRAFTLTELLVVITIIAILAGLITGAAINALNRAKQAAITLEIQQLDGSLEDFKNTYGAYPPNGMSPEDPIVMTTPDGTELRVLHGNDFVLMFRKAFPRHNEDDNLLRALAGVDPGGSLSDRYLEEGMRSSEALVFWLGGFSADTQYPISGPGGPSYRTDVTNPIEDLEGRNRRYDFDLGRLGPRDSTNSFSGRFIEYIDPQNNTITRRINFWTYTPSGSIEPIAYFDVSRHRAQVQTGPTTFVHNYDPWFYESPTHDGFGYALKRLNETNPGRVEFVNQGKFQILHCGIDDIWGEGLQAFGLYDATGAPKLNNLVVKYPTGPFLNDVADTVGNFMTGTLADEQE